MTWIVAMHRIINGCVMCIHVDCTIRIIYRTEIICFACVEWAINCWMCASPSTECKRNDMTEVAFAPLHIHIFSQRTEHSVYKRNSVESKSISKWVNFSFVAKLEANGCTFIRCYCTRFSIYCCWCVLNLCSIFNRNWSKYIAR